MLIFGLLVGNWVFLENEYPAVKVKELETKLSRVGTS
jgi:hypothetical protein